MNRQFFRVWWFKPLYSFEDLKNCLLKIKCKVKTQLEVLEIIRKWVWVTEKELISSKLCAKNFFNQELCYNLHIIIDIQRSLIKSRMIWTYGKTLIKTQSIKCLRPIKILIEQNF